jgi:hypothetical protein
MHLADINPDCPLMIAEVSETIQGQVQTLSDTHACRAPEKQGGGL